MKTISNFFWFFHSLITQRGVKNTSRIINYNQKRKNNVKTVILTKTEILFKLIFLKQNNESSCYLSLINDSVSRVRGWFSMPLFEVI